MKNLLKFYKSFTGFYNKWEVNPGGKLLFAIIVLLNVQALGIYGILTGGISLWFFFTVMVLYKKLEMQDPLVINRMKEERKRAYYNIYGDNKEQEW